MVNRQPSNGQKFNRQPSKKGKFLTSTFKRVVVINRQTVLKSSNLTISAAHLGLLTLKKPFLTGKSSLHVPKTTLLAVVSTHLRLN